eukprot:TRINITY_DN5744_c3_g1_i1.p2 TRINITY_DN5744_c3_g1~~TRINITY_DN5744_c3_g1_i1.p2  ORF type:complete len:151 (-),score=25.35 TRINITY_DN5744_c3_g1_i1:102-518(-)
MTRFCIYRIILVLFSSIVSAEKESIAVDASGSFSSFFEDPNLKDGLPLTTEQHCVKMCEEKGHQDLGESCAKFARTLPRMPEHVRNDPKVQSTHAICDHAKQEHRQTCERKCGVTKGDDMIEKAQQLIREMEATMDTR